MATWRLAKSLMVLREQINKEWPTRSKVSDGTIGDTAHSTRKSDHNPNEDNVVQAIDLTDDDSVGADMGKVAESLRSSRDPRIKYVIHAGRYFSPKTLWQWKKYVGLNDHAKHMHVSVQDSRSLYDNMKEWNIGEEEMPQFDAAQEKILKDICAAIEREGSNGDSVGFMIKAIRWLRTKFPGEAP